MGKIKGGTNSVLLFPFFMFAYSWDHVRVLVIQEKIKGGERNRDVSVVIYFFESGTFGLKR